MDLNVKSLPAETDNQLERLASLGWSKTDAVIDGIALLHRAAIASGKTRDAAVIDYIEKWALIETN